MRHLVITVSMRSCVRSHAMCCRRYVLQALASPRRAASARLRNSAYTCQCVRASLPALWCPSRSPFVFGNKPAAILYFHTKDAAEQAVKMSHAIPHGRSVTAKWCIKWWNAKGQKILGIWIMYCCRYGIITYNNYSMVICLPAYDAYFSIYHDSAMLVGFIVICSYNKVWWKCNDRNDFNDHVFVCILDQIQDSQGFENVWWKCGDGNISLVQSSC